MLDQKFSRYEIREELGIGGMATVFRAYDPMFEREVAVKILKRELLEDPQVKGRFQRETKIIAKLEHPAIVPVYDVGYDNNQLFYVMRYMTGGSLSERIEKGLTLKEIAHIILRISAALDYAHSKGIVHRDLKPGNILFDENNTPYISDFGIAKVAEAATRITNSGIIGTPRYMSPEQARGDEADGRSDLYALGVILYEMLSGKTPFEATTPLAMAFKHATEPPPSILNVNPHLPPEIDGVIVKTLEKNPDDRYNTCAEFANAFIATLPPLSSPDSNLIITMLPPPAPNYDSPTELPLAPKRPPASASKPRSWMTKILVPLMLIGLALIGYQSYETTDAASTPTLAPVMPTQTVAFTQTFTPTNTLAPTESLTPTSTTIPVIPGIGGADKIALTANYDIYLMDMNGKNIQQLTNTNTPKFDLQWLNENELLYGEEKCVYKINAFEPGSKPESLACLEDKDFAGFRVSPDGKHVAISIAHRLIVYPFDLEFLSTVKTMFELQNSRDICFDYSEVTVKGAQWSADGTNLAVLYQSFINNALVDIIRVIQVNLQRCQEVDPLILDEVIADEFIPSFHWDGDQIFLFNIYKRNEEYGQLYQYDMSTSQARLINPVNGLCCYQDATFSPDGSHILFFFQDEASGSESQIQMYYIPVDRLGTGAAFTPIKLPVRFFPNPRENIQVALHPSAP
jgi:serine/threonine protein kinase